MFNPQYILTFMMTEPCLSCEKCCCRVGFIVEIFETDEIFNDESLVWQNKNMRKTIKSNGDGYTCIALKENGECNIYHKRPRVCREFEAGGERCVALRKYETQST